MSDSPTSIAPEGIAEAQFARLLGLARSDFKKLRETLLSPGIDWAGGSGAPILIWASGQSKILSALQKSAAGEKEPAHANGAVHEEPAAYALETASRVATHERLIVSRVTRNGRLLEAVRELPSGEKELCRVQVRSTANFCQGMALEPCVRGPEPGFYYYHGRLPRSRRDRL